MRFNYKFENKLGMKYLKYYQGKIYKITSPHTDKIYIGSTTQPLRKRLNEHKNNKIKSITSAELFKLGDCKIELIEEYPCESRKELTRREGIYILNNPNCVNKHVAGRTKKESARIDYLKNKEHYKRQAVETKKRNKEHIQQQYKEKFICECGGHYTKYHKNRHLKTTKHIQFINQ
jgi:hypothetical protein